MKKGKQNQPSPFIPLPEGEGRGFVPRPLGEGPLTEKLQEPKARVRAGYPRSGFTLVEIVISICIISIAFYTLINVLSGVTYKNVGSQQLLTASFLAEEAMEEYTVKSWDNIISRAAQNYSGEFSNFYNKVDVIFVDLANLNGTAAGSTDYKRIEVTVTGEALTYPVKLVGFKAKY